jgi:hypothetical protein
MKGSLPFSRPYGTQFLFLDFIPSTEVLGYYHAPLTGLSCLLLLFKLLLTTFSSSNCPARGSWLGNGGRHDLRMHHVCITRHVGWTLFE